MSTRNIGNKYEEEAVRYLINEEYSILDRNFYTKYGELDIVAMNDGYLCFIEVRFKSGTAYGHPAESIDIKKQKRIIKAAQYYLYVNHYHENTPCRFDAVLLYGNNMNIIKDAFQL